MQTTIKTFFVRTAYLETSGNFLVCARNSLFMHTNFKNKTPFYNKLFIDNLRLFKSLSVTAAKYLIDLTAIDCFGLSSYKNKFLRFNIYYNFTSLANMRYLFSLNTNDTKIESCVGLFAGTEWLERELWDMFGVHIINNNKLRRILTDYGFRGHPLRKDFPVVGFNEVNYSGELLSVIYAKVSLQQEYRKFNIISGWRRSRRNIETVIY